MKHPRSTQTTSARSAYISISTRPAGLILTAPSLCSPSHLPLRQITTIYGRAGRAAAPGGGAAGRAEAASQAMARGRIVIVLRGGGGGGGVYRVEPREFRDLVQRLTGATPLRHHHRQVAAVQPVPVRASGDSTSTSTSSNSTTRRGSRSRWAGWTAPCNGLM